jgi:protein involved in ribonucleotide reduction
VDIVYFSNYSGNTHRFVQKLNVNSIRIPISQEDNDPILIKTPYILIVPTYGGGSEKSAIPRQVRAFLNISGNREKLIGVIGTGNTNFGEHYCKAVELIAAKTGVPIIGRVEIFGTDEDVKQITERLAMLDDKQL